MSKLRFYSPDGTDIRVTLPNGHVAIVGAEPRELPPMFNRAALREGCLTTDMPPAARMKGPEVPLESDPFTRREAIKAKIAEAFNSEEGAPGYEEAFTNAGIPNINWLSQQVGFTVERAERDELWAEVQADADAEDGEQGGNGGDLNLE